MSLKKLALGLPLDPLPPRRYERDTTIPHAPVRKPKLTRAETKQALRNALRYFPFRLHPELAPEFVQELREYGHIYMYRFIPDFELRAYPIGDYPCKIRHAAAIMLMIMNNLDHKVAQFPHELVTYGGNGQVFSNWAQFWITMQYLSEMTDSQTLSMCSGHPLGLFPSSPEAPRMVITNGMVIPNYSSKEEYEKMFAMGVTMYGQMTAGSYCYIGPQGIVHGTTLTITNAGIKALHVEELSGKVLITSGLGGMSGAQAKAAVIAGCIGVIAEVDKAALMKRYEQGWLMKWTDSLDECIEMIKKSKAAKEAMSIGYLGNVVDLWERLAEEYERTGVLLAELGTDQTSCHNPYGGGYYPVGMSFEEAKTCLAKNQEKFKIMVNGSLQRQVLAINKLAKAGMFFWDYGNAFLLEAGRAGADVLKEGSDHEFKYPSYVEHIMGDIFSMGFGPFRWVCTSGKDDDLALTDQIATEIVENLIKTEHPSVPMHIQYSYNIKWIKEAAKHDLVVGSKARILYSDQVGRAKIAVALNEAVKDGRLSGEVVISRDHHDVSGTDSPFRETSNIGDGSKFCADMAVQNCIGDSFRGATWVALHNGGGVGWGEVMNGGFGLVLDGTDEAKRKAQSMLNWDVSNGVARRAWANNLTANSTIKRAMERDSNLKVTVRNEVVNEQVLDDALAE